MQPQIIGVTGVAASKAMPQDFYISPFNIGFAVVVSGTVTYSVQHTYDNVQNATVTPTWFNHPTVTSLSANQDGTYAFPVTAIRINVTAGTGTATMTSIQAGLVGG